MAKPFIAVATSRTDIIPGHIHMARLERFIERGIAAAGGVPFFFGVPGICDGIAMGHTGMKYSLASRELIADMVETIMKAHCFDGLVCLTNCDKITPGMLMAVGRLNVPSIVITAGPMMSGNLRGRRLSLVKDTFEAVGRFKKNIEEAMEDDFNTAQAIGHMYELARQINRVMDTIRPKELKGLADQFNLAADLIKQYGLVLGILTLSPQAFLEQERTRLLQKKGLSQEVIEGLIAERNQARQEKDWARADALRDRLTEMNVLLKDTPQGTLWQIEE
jgi:hypothetical protein